MNAKLNKFHPYYHSSAFRLCSCLLNDVFCSRIIGRWLWLWPIWLCKSNCSRLSLRYKMGKLTLFLSRCSLISPCVFPLNHARVHGKNRATEGDWQKRFHTFLPHNFRPRKEIQKPGRTNHILTARLIHSSTVQGANRKATIHRFKEKRKKWKSKGDDEKRRQKWI